MQHDRTVLHVIQRARSSSPNGTIMLQKLFNPEWQITSKSFLLSTFLIGFSFSPTAEISRLELEFEESLRRKTASIFKEGIRLRPQEIWERDYKAGTIRNPRQKLQLIHDPQCFQNPPIRSIYRKNPQSVRFLRPNPSIREPIHPPPRAFYDLNTS